MKKNAVAHLVLDSAYRWWWLRSFAPDERVPVAGVVDHVDASGTRRVLQPIAKTRYARLMASEGFAGWCRPGHYVLKTYTLTPPVLEPLNETDQLAEAS